MTGTDDNSPSYEGSDLEALATLHRYQRWIVSTFESYLTGRAVEFGAGTGNMSRLLRSYVSTLDLIEPSKNLADPLRQRFANDDGITVYDDSLEDRLPAIADESYDTVVLVNVLEHIEGDGAALEGFFRILKPGGHLLLFVPALRFLYSDLDKLVGHFRRYQQPELNGRVTDAGFDIIKSRYFDAIGVVPWWLLNTVMGSTGFNPRLISIYDAVLTPISRGLESVIKPPFGKNIVLAARRPEAPKK